jgi:hypothetical protein
VEAVPVRGFSIKEAASVRPPAISGDAGRAGDIDLMLAELRRLDVEPSHFLRIVRPMQAAMLLAATPPGGELDPPDDPFGGEEPDEG